MMLDSEGHGRVTVRTILSALAILALAATVAFLQVSEHRTPRSTFADQHSPDRIATLEGLSVDGFANPEDTHPINLDGAKMLGTP